MHVTDLVIRTTNEEDWREWRELRLEMLRDTPLAYAETLEHALTVDEAGWRARAARGTAPRQTSIVAIDGERWVGHMGGYIPDATSGPLLVGVYVAPDYRGDVAGVEVHDEVALNQEQRAFASAIGKAFAETAHQVTAVVGPKKRR